MYPEGTMEYNVFAEKYIEWYNNWLGSLKTALLDSDEDEDDDSAEETYTHSTSALGNSSNDKEA
jgi:hypothetical protein